MGSVPNGANLTGLWDGSKGFSPADSGNGFKDEGLCDLAHFPHELSKSLVIVDGLLHLRGLLLG